MFGLLSVAILLAVGIAVLGVFWAIAALVCWLFVLPFKLLALVFKGLALLMLAPLLLAVAAGAALLFGAGLLAFLAPAIPFVLLVAAIVWLARRAHRPAVAR